MLFQFVFHVGERELGAPDWNVEFRKNPRQRADVVFVTMGENNAAHALPVFGEIRDVGNHDVHAEQVRLRGTSGRRR